MTESINLLLVEDNPDDAANLYEMVAELESGSHDGSRFRFNIVHRTSIAEAGRYLAGYPGVNLILLDLSLPDSEGLDGLRKLEIWIYEIPIIILSGQSDTALAISAIRRGAQDYLLKGRTSADMLLRSMRYAMERHKMVVMLRNLSIIDNQTGLYNRKGFLALLESRIPIVRHEKLDSCLFLVEIRAAAGKDKSAVYISAAEILRRCIRETDVVARTGEGEFALFTVSLKDDVEPVSERIGRGFADMQKNGMLSISLGHAANPHSGTASADDLLRQAREAIPS